MPPQDSPGDAALVRYLLGTVSREEEERLDELSIVDPQFADRLRGVEDDLADAYVRGELTESDRVRYRERYLASARGAEGQQLAQALAAREQRGVRPRQASTYIWGLAAAAVLILATATAYIVVHDRERAPAPAAAAAAPAKAPTIAPEPSPATPSAPGASEPSFVAMTLAPSQRSLVAPPILHLPHGTTEVRLTL